MNNQIVISLDNEKSHYFQAMNLAERVFHASKTNSQIESFPDSSLDVVISDWKQTYPFSEEGAFSQRLEAVGIAEEDLLHYLVQRSSLRFSNEPEWVKRIEKIWESFDPDKDHVSFPSELSARWPETRFLEIFQPFLQHTLLKFEKGITNLSRKYPTMPFEQNNIVKTFLMNVPSLLIWATSRTLVLELHVARLQGDLQADTPRERFEEFLDLYRQPQKLRCLMEEYPVLSRTLTTIFYQWYVNVLDFCTHLCQDWENIQVQFGLNKVDTLDEIHIGAGDRHRNGRSVILARFKSGTRLVYKPRSLAIDKEFQELLLWLNKRNDFATFRPLSIIDCETYGWVEFVEALPCKSKREIKQFYLHLGAYLALLYSFGATDFHFENIIAEGVNPVLIDIETLFSPVKAEKTPYHLPAHSFLADSVMAVGLLPHRVWTEGQSGGVDISGLGMEDGQLTPSPIPIWEQVHTDNMHLSRARRPILGGSHQPLLKGKPVEAVQFSSEIIEGFTLMYRLLMTQRAALLAKNGPLVKFADTEIRMLLRPTRVYSLLLQESLHPDLMQDAVEMDKHFDRLWAGAYQSDSLRSSVTFEHADLWRFDIPIFTTKASSTCLETSNYARIDDFFRRSGLEQAMNKIKHLSEADLVKQCWLISTSLKTKERANSRENDKTFYNPEKIGSASMLKGDIFLSEAIKIGEHLKTMAFEDDEHVWWLGVRYTEEGSYWTIVPLDISLYSGLSGIALFLAYLGKTTNDKSYTDLAQKTVKTILYCFDNDEYFLNDIGAFEGLGGMLYLTAHVGILWKDKELLEKGMEIANSLEQYIEKDTKFDIISGSAGCIASLLVLYKVTSQTDLLHIANSCGQHLIDNVLLEDGRPAWLQQGNPMIDRPLTGFSHGVAGIAWSLMRLSKAVNDPKYKETAQKSLSYEREMFSEATHNWPDLRNFSIYQNFQTPTEPGYLSFWCHGATGIGHARLFTLKERLTDDPLIAVEVETAFHTTLREGFGQGHCLCHGDFGSLDFLISANTYLNLHMDEPIELLALGTIASIHSYGWLCGNGLQVEEPGLMTGLAGIGFQLLRLSHPEQVPSVLALESPNLI
ncbi:type 2 lanthipeptide synthetase LanM family protein [Candidatus Leptofilum sp.]|uniref:type 2 lanthipeptide synthetase LanM family protein n=1 Tax=Candidatus Leptofilum sp. TaxID=3241576 RepID=UPI003B597493